jgi:hypothetical protein
LADQWIDKKKWLNGSLPDAPPMRGVWLMRGACAWLLARLPAPADNGYGYGRITVSKKILKNINLNGLTIVCVASGKAIHGAQLACGRAARLSPLQ